MPRLSQGRVGSLSEGSESSLSHVVYLYGRQARLYSYSCEYYSYHVNIDMQFPHEYEYANTSVFIFMHEYEYGEIGVFILIFMNTIVFKGCPVMSLTLRRCAGTHGYKSSM